MSNVTNYRLVRNALRNELSEEEIAVAVGALAIGQYRRADRGTPIICVLLSEELYAFDPITEEDFIIKSGEQIDPIFRQRDPTLSAAILQFIKDTIAALPEEATEEQYHAF